ncbi:MAG: hypothetical protein JXA21_13560 [Anaerolineae bacterium]|nr:hypothetical protein [Anaerolineae bacterium]
MNTKMKRGMLSFLSLWVVFTLMSCDKTKPAMDTSPLVSPLVSPLAAVSPLGGPTALPVIPTPTSLLGADFDLATAVLTAEDMAELFNNTTYSITQPYEKEGMRGLQVMYPTKSIDYETSFAEGFETQIEVYDVFDDLLKAYYDIVAKQTGMLFELKTKADETQAFKKTSEYVADVQDHIILIREANALVIIEVKTSENVPPVTFEKIVNLVVDRLEP